MPADVQRFLVERDIIAMHRVMSDLLRACVDYTRAEFGYPGTDAGQRLESLFGVRPRFDCPHTVFGIDPGLLARPLRRHLEAAGTSYRALLDEVRRTLAEEMLTATPLSVDDIAIRLGYAEATPFIHAFKRWTGTTPAAHRRAHLRD
ncbi:helix-turn-helix domain-containing protein [Nocardia sp. NPDC059246]|uniref:helix-turn-helix domain-containing protein n=1 Tax=unclassified Nocardia TaxID=2637762 RepID=UPI0036B3DD6B